MILTKEFKATLASPNIEESVNNFIKELTAEQFIDIKYNTNILNIKKQDGNTDVIILSSVLILFEN